MSEQQWIVRVEIIGRDYDGVGDTWYDHELGPTDNETAHWRADVILANGFRVLRGSHQYNPPCYSGDGGERSKEENAKEVYWYFPVHMISRVEVRPKE